MMNVRFNCVFSILGNLVYRNVYCHVNYGIYTGTAKNVSLLCDGEDVIRFIVETKHRDLNPGYRLAQVISHFTQ